MSRTSLRLCLAAALLLLPGAATRAQKPYRGAEYRTIQTMTYGRFETRIRSAGVSGMLSSFFTYYDPASPWNEIDIETMGRYTNEIQFNTIVPSQAGNHVKSQTVPFNPHAAFHVLGFEWTPDYVAWRIDGDEVYRQTGSHIAQITKAQKLMMNIWQPSSVEWAGPFNPAQLPAYAYYDWVKYYAYTPGTGDNFTLQWTDDFTAFDATRWQKATHTWDGNNAQFVTGNAVIRDGYLILCLTSNTTSGYSGGTIPDADVDAPYLISARAYDSTVVVRFSEPVTAASAENTTNYFGGSGLTYRSAKLRADGRTVDLTIGGMNHAYSFVLFVQGIQDLASPAHTMTMKPISVVMPLAFPIRIDVGGSGGSGYLADSLWSVSQQYGTVGGARSSLLQSTPVLNTTEPQIYRSSLHGLSGYKVRVPNGTYKVTLMMAEDRIAAAGKRIFSARVEGESLFTGLDLFQQAGLVTAYTAVAPAVQVSDNILDVWLGASADSTLLSGITVERVGGPTGVGEQQEGLPSWGFSVYPNPLNGSAVFRYVVPADGPASVTIHDNLGRTVADIELGSVSAGTHDYRWSAENLSSGVYYCTLRGGGQLATRKILLMK